MDIGFYRQQDACGEGFWFEVMTGVRQGSVLSPLLYILLMDQVLKQATTKVAGGDHSDTLANADDVGLIACSASELQNSINKWCSSLKDNGLKLNEAKSEVMVVSRVPETVHIIANGRELNQVEEFKYLGVVYDLSLIHI